MICEDLDEEVEYHEEKSKRYRGKQNKRVITDEGTKRR